MDGVLTYILRWLMDWDLEVRLLYASLSFNREYNKSSQHSQSGVHAHGDTNSILLYDTCAHPQLLFSDSSFWCSLSLSFAIASSHFRHLPPGNTPSHLSASAVRLWTVQSFSVISYYWGFGFWAAYRQMSAVGSLALTLELIGDRYESLHN